MTAQFIPRLKTAVAGEEDARFVFLGNFEVEDVWGEGEPGLPRMAFGSGSAVVNRMDEFAMLLAGPGDRVLLKAAPDPDYLAFLEGLGVALPEIHTVAAQNPQQTVSQDVLDDPELLRLVAEWAEQGAYLSVHGVSVLEEEIARRAGIRIAASSAEICKAVNSKVYSRRVADELGLRQPAGRGCRTLTEWSAAVTWAKEILASGRRVVVKDAYGVSGKGIVVVDDPRRLDQMDRMVSRKARTTGSERVGLVVEEFVAKRADLNYQMTVGRDGDVRFDFVKEAITESGVHKGHRIPARLDGRQEAEIREAARLLGERLHADGYVGVAGVDAMVGDDEQLFPVTEINARNNMSTYQLPLQERFVPEGWVALARQYPLRLPEPLPFKRLDRALGEVLLKRAGEEGVLVNNFATVNAAAGGDGGFDGRLYALVIAPTEDRVRELDEHVAGVVAGLTERTGS
ncbi:ATP-grasp domain-containing protein [Micromonospora phaseoli]|uniref:ATP-grasp domain-containing protein n=1 Tax=Micromonospora phaseoli TaxID=1144548 RepID=A0A1H7AW86_9ACTN|nr:ATP-grasp domain-containing protein [Micromonospora phaseoli]PZV96165.1 ATP-grasp domain-containing protein [Micromonospora phaseoli]GIJ79440.1 phosphoribosylglycinamide formyltransferase 2 [Micromonospora phaseoli]SEJ69206.1 ATP-grasp domain-containing protein [Micromonospora phaseoli]